MKLMSIGFFLDDNAPVMWRGPMLHRALEQFLTDVHWGELDVLVVDMPPGTGDVSISLGQLLPRAEAVVVTTPQPLAQEVAPRAAMMAQKTGMRVLGVVENMTSGGVRRGRRRAARRASSACRCSARCRSTRALREAGDAGEPLVSADPEAEAARAIVAIARARSTPRTQALHAPLPLRLLRRRRGPPARGARLRRRRRETLAAHFLDAERRGRAGHGFRASSGSRRSPISTRRRRPSGVVAEPGYERWDGHGALGYLTLAAIVDAQLADPPERARVVVAGRAFPTGCSATGRAGSPTAASSRR